MSNPYATDYAALGLGHYQPFQTAFTAVPPKGIDRPYIAPKKHGPALSKVQQAAISLESSEERRERTARAKLALDQQGRARVDLAPRTAGAIKIHSQADAAKTTRIKKGRAI